VNDFMTDIDRRAVFLERPLDDIDGAFDPGAKAARLSQYDAQRLSVVAHRRLSFHYYLSAKPLARR